jgi:hypothetical protein
MVHSKVNANAYAKRLRHRQKELYAAHKKALSKFDEEVRSWKVALTRWLRDHGYARVEAITKNSLRGNMRYHAREELGFCTDDFFKGAPKAPKPPSDAVLRKVQMTLRHLAMTGQTSIVVTIEDTEKLFGAGEDE